MHIKGFEELSHVISDVKIAWSEGGDGPPLLMLHGFPQTRALWSKIAPSLSKSRRVICPDLRGYGESGKPDDAAEYSFRKMAQDQILLMRHLGFEKFEVVGHDRGGRVAHRMALDAPECVTRMALLDIVPTHSLLCPLQKDVAKDYYHWFFLSQPEPFPERMIGYDPDSYFESCLLGWGAARIEDFANDQMTAYKRSWSDPDTIRGMCNDYRSTLSHDVHDDADDLEARVSCPTLILYGAGGAMARAFDMKAVWSTKCVNVSVKSIEGGHFFPDTAPDETTAALEQFFNIDR